MFIQLYTKGAFRYFNLSLNVVVFFSFIILVTVIIVKLYVIDWSAGTAPDLKLIDDHEWPDIRRHSDSVKQWHRLNSNWEGGAGINARIHQHSILL